jgi:hypothetical protein
LRFLPSKIPTLEKKKKKKQRPTSQLQNPEKEEEERGDIKETEEVSQVTKKALFCSVLNSLLSTLE